MSASPDSEPHGRANDAPLAERLLAPFRRFTATASAGGIVLLAATAIALAWANSPWAHGYHALWEVPLGVSLGELALRGTLHELVNDGLMAVFFFLVGLEIKRETIAGELASLRTAALPMFAALGGMLVPALCFVVLNRGGAGASGWGVPMATDIAFALGVLALLGDRVPVGLKVFLAALAIVDDIGAVLVIAVFYSGGVVWSALGLAALLLLVSAGANAAGVRRPWVYGVIGVALWMAVLASGVHATVAGVLLAMTIPTRSRVNEPVFLAAAHAALRDFDDAARVTAGDPETTILSNTDHHGALEDLETLCEMAQPPLIRIERSLHWIVGFVIMPVFALANAGVTLSGDAIGAALGSPVTLGVALGLVLGKPVGITLFSWLAVRLGFAGLPRGVSWPMIAGAGVLGGIGFTMALFIAGLAFADAALLDAAKAGVLAASTLAGVGGWLLLRRASASAAATPAAPSRTGSAGSA
ncbi:MAG: Na(+)/H(+) antiporter nhaA [Gemmatimonadetes bacterium]|nr:Na(+)/H(+) antiporter nhaA [Gemmatimonadota bacterium]